MNQSTAPGGLVFLHGFTGNQHSFDRLGLAGASPLLCGHGAEPDLSSQNFEAEVARIASSIRSGDGPVHLVGYSMGARVALAMGITRPDLVARLTLIGVNPGLRSVGEREERLAWEQGWQELLKREGLIRFEKKWSDIPLFSSQRNLPEELIEQQRAQRLAHTADGLAQALRVLGLGTMPDLWPRLGQLSLPVNVVVGSVDMKFSGIGAELRASLPQIRLFSLNGIGHNPLLEAPAELARIIAHS